MEEKPPFKLELFVSLVILLAFLAINVESQQQPPQQQRQKQQNGQQMNAPSPPPPSQPLPLPPPSLPPPSRLSPLPLPPPLVPPPPSPHHSPPTPGNSNHLAPPPYHLYKVVHSPPKSPNELVTNSQLNHRETQRKKHNLNKGQSIGLLFAGIAIILQIGVVGFLAFKSRQLLKMRD